jgi:MFS family permease
LCVSLDDPVVTELLSLGSLAIGLSPTCEMMGTGASAILIVARLLQGLAHGGELPTAQVYLAEVAPAARRGFWSSLIYVSGAVGILFGTLLGAVLSGALSDEQMQAFGWRLPFILGAVFGIVALLVRSRMEDPQSLNPGSARMPPRSEPDRLPQSRASSPTSHGTGVRHCRSWA